MTVPPRTDGNDDFQRLRAEAQQVLAALLAPQGDLGTMGGVNAEVERGRAFAAMDCWAPKWLKAAFEEVDRQASWSDLRQRQVQAVLELHIPVEVDQVWGPMEVNYCGPLVCGECGESFPCKTRNVVLSIERDWTRLKEG